MKESLVFLAFGACAGFLAGRYTMYREKVRAVTAGRDNTVEIVRVSESVKEKVKNADEICRDIFNIDLSGCMQ